MTRIFNLNKQNSTKQYNQLKFLPNIQYHFIKNAVFGYLLFPNDHYYIQRYKKLIIILFVFIKQTNKYNPKKHIRSHLFIFVIFNNNKKKQKFIIFTFDRNILLSLSDPYIHKRSIFSNLLTHR
jgi:hypothetical protein